MSFIRPPLNFGLALGSFLIVLWKMLVSYWMLLASWLLVYITCICMCCKKDGLQYIYCVFQSTHTCTYTQKPACVYIKKSINLHRSVQVSDRAPISRPCPAFLRRIWNSIECLNACENDPHPKRQHECVRLIGVWFEFLSPLLMRGKMHKEMKREYEADEKMAMSQPWAMALVWRKFGDIRRAWLPEKVSIFSRC